MIYNVIDENGNVINVIVWDGVTPLDLDIKYRMEMVTYTEEEGETDSEI